MQEWDVWIDLEAPHGEGNQIICTLFASLNFSIRPNIGERISFHSPHDSENIFQLQMSWGSIPSNTVSCAVDDISHSRSALHEFSTMLRCEPLAVASISDANKVVQFLRKHHGFEIDPCGVNNLGK